MPTIIIKDRIYIPAKIVDTELLEEKFLKQVFAEDKCKKCPYIAERPSDVCDECPANLGLFKLYNEKKINSKLHYGVSVGTKSEFKKIINTKKFEVDDQRVSPKFKHKIKFTGTLREDQIPAVEKISKRHNGFLVSPPRSGKTVMTSAAIINKGWRTLIMASQYDWLEQFYTTFVGNKEENEKAFSNIPELRKKTGKEIISLAKDGTPLSNYADSDIVLCTYQRFLSKKGQKELKKIKKSFGTLLVDEADVAAANAFSKVVNAFYCRSRLACTGTRNRKDSREWILDHIFGGVLHTVEIESLVPQVKMIETGYVNKHMYKVLPYAYRALADNEKRNELILDWVIHDLKTNKLNSIVIPTTTVKHVNYLVKEINKRMGKIVACGFTASTAKTKQRRTEIKSMAKSREYRVIVGIRKMVQRGINVPAWSHLYEIMPIANVPSHTQEVSRILTPMEGKPKPIIRQFLDDFGLVRGCLRTAVYQVYAKKKFEISKQDWAIANKYLKQGEIKTERHLPSGREKSKTTKTKKGMLI